MKRKLFRSPKFPITLMAGLAGVFIIVPAVPAQMWQQTAAPSATWRGIAASADFTRIVAAESGYGGIEGQCYCRVHYSGIYALDTGGSLQETNAPNEDWVAITMSADGMKLAAAASDLIYTSDDAGANWNVSGAPTNGWTAIASSANGTKLVAAAGAGGIYSPGGNVIYSVGPNQIGSSTPGIYTSSNSGATWTMTSAPGVGWTTVASSADGTKLVAAAKWTSVYTSTNSGVNWAVTATPVTNWSAVASSADGVRLAAVVNGGLIYLSGNSGETWTPSTAPFGYWSSVASSADGSMLLAADGTNGLIYASTNFGAEWVLDDSAPLSGLVACSADGNERVAAGSVAGVPDAVWTWPYLGPWRRLEAPPASWQAVATSADGTKSIAASEDGIYRSSDSGVTWLQTSASTTNYWSSVASSSDGTKLVATASSLYSSGYSYSQPSDGIYTSSDSGATWSHSSAPTTNAWVSVASSADGTKLVAVATGYDFWVAGQDHFIPGGVYSSSNSGATWIRAGAQPDTSFVSVASSADGTKLLVATGSDLYTSSDSGSSWLAVTPPVTNYGAEWASVASSSDGTKLITAEVGYNIWDGSVAPGSVYVSVNSGATWLQSKAPLDYWSSVACSADGTRMLAMSSDEQMAWSGDSGATWVTMQLPVNGSGAIACSVDASNIIAVINGVGIYQVNLPAPPTPSPPPPRLITSRSTADLNVSWLVPSSAFVLQVNPDLATTNWTDVSTPPLLNFTNLNYQMTVSPVSNSKFYRLKQP